MKILSFDTTTKDLVVALYIDGRITGSVVKDCLRGHSELLLPEIDRLLSARGLELSDMDLFGVCVGPGSFTGIRIGVTTARTFCQVTGRPVVAVNSLEYRAYNVQCQKKCVALDAMQNKVYYALFDGEREIVSPSYCEKQELGGLLPEEFRKFADSGEFRVFADTELGIAWEDFSELASRLARFVFDRRDRSAAFETVVPLYIRQCQAEEQASKSL